jgi:putative ABC transport system permease protein
MILNYLKVALRSITRSKLTSFINIAGLALAMTCCLLIYLFINDELSYDRYHTHADRIYRVTRNFLSQDGTVNLHLGHVAPPFGPLLKNDFADIKEVARTLQYNVLFAIEEGGERKLSFNEPNTFLAEPSIFNIFTIPVLKGDARAGLSRPFTVMISDKMAGKYFGNQEVQGKHFRVNNAFDLEITGVFQSFPDQSHWHPDFLVSFSTLEDDNIYGRRGLETNWGNNSFATYILVNDQFDPVKVASEFPAFIDRHMGQEAQANNYPMPSTWTNLFLQRLTDIHLRSHLDSEVEANGNINNVYMMAVIGLVIILIACFNFINLSTARATKRAKEVGLRKVVGAIRNQLIFQYLSESIIVALCSLGLALILTAFSIGWLNDFTEKSLQLNLLTNASVITLIIAATLLVGAIAGIYPAFIISGFKPALILKGQQGSTKGKTGIRKVLVVAQFATSIVLIIATVIIIQQLRFMNNRDLGYEKDQVITMRYYGDGLENTYDAFYNELIKNSVVKNVGRSSRVPTGRLLDSQGAQIQKGDSMVSTDVVIKNVRVDHHFFDTYGIPMSAGRNFSKEIKSDDSLAFVLNESAVQMIGWTNDEAPGKVLQYGGVKGQVIGVVRDFHFESLHEPIVPLVFHLSPFFNRLSVAIAGKEMQAGVAHIEKTWKEFLPQRPFEYSFLSDQYRDLYEGEQKQSQLFLIFSGLAIFIASLGLFGLATFNTLQRIREIGIRKVLGASVPTILKLLSTEIVILVLIANLIAWPVAWYFMNQWLDGFAYRINMNIGIYLLAAIVAIIIALVTVSTQTIKAAMANPANTLRHE